MNDEQRLLRNLRISVEARCLAAMEKQGKPRDEKLLVQMADGIENGTKPYVETIRQIDKQFAVNAEKLKARYAKLEPVAPHLVPRNVQKLTPEQEAYLQQMQQGCTAKLHLSELVATNPY